MGKGFVIFFVLSVLCWGTSAFFSIKKSKKIALLFQTVGVLVFVGFVVWLWGALQRPPVLQSVWFIPHVAAYLIGYVVIGCAVLLSFASFAVKKNSNTIHVLIKIGTLALGMGLCFGMLWAKKAWGQYWSWDIKETAALITWLFFILYIHLQKLTKINRKILFIILMMGFLSLQFTWFGVKYLPNSQKSPHTFYSNTENN